MMGALTQESALDRVRPLANSNKKLPQMPQKKMPVLQPVLGLSGLRRPGPAKTQLITHAFYFCVFALGLFYLTHLLAGVYYGG